MSWCNVVSFLKATPMFVCFNNIVIFLILGLWWVNVVHNVCLFLQFGYDQFCVIFDGLISVEGFVGICYFWLLLYQVNSFFFLRS